MRGHRRAAVEDVDVAVEREALGFEHAKRRTAAGMRLAHHRFGAIGEEVDVDRRLGHQVGDEAGAVDSSL